MRVLEAGGEIAEAQEMFIQTFRSASSKTQSVSIGFQGGNVEKDVLWIPSISIWGFFGDPPLEKSPGERFWNVFGKGKPHGMVNIVAEINPPKHAINRQVGGAFLMMDGGSYGVAHRGIFTASGRVPYDFVRKHFDFPTTQLSDGNRKSDLYVIGRFSEPRFLDSLRDFIDAVDGFKSIAKKRS